MTALPGDPGHGDGPGVKRVKRQDLLHGVLFLHDPASATYTTLTEPMVLAPEPGEHSAYNATIVERCRGKVFGPGCVMLTSAVTGLGWSGQPIWPHLVPAPDGYDPALLVVNEPVEQVRCRACSIPLIEPVPRPGVRWRPVRATYLPPRKDPRYAVASPTRPGPHPATAPACRACYPAAWEGK